MLACACNLVRPSLAKTLRRLSRGLRVPSALLDLLSEFLFVQSSPHSGVQSSLHLDTGVEIAPTVEMRPILRGGQWYVT